MNNAIVDVRNVSITLIPSKAPYGLFAIKISPYNQVRF